MSESLRVKDVENQQQKEGATIKIKNNGGDIPVANKRSVSVVFAEMWADAFMRKKMPKQIDDDLEQKLKPPAPYIYLRFFVMYIILFVVSLSVFYFFEGYELFPVLCVILVTVIPAVGSIFFYEMDTSGKISLFNVLFVLCVSAAVELIVQFATRRFVYLPDGEISIYGAMAIGLIETFLVFLLVTWFINQIGIKNILSGILVGVIIGCGFALAHNAVICFDKIFIETQYAPTIKALIFNESLLESFSVVMDETIMEFIFHSLVYVLCCGIFAGVFVIVKNTLKKEKNGIVLAFVIALGSWVVLFVWVMPVTVLPQPFSYILKGIIVIAEIIAIVKTMRIGLRSNKYE